MELSLTINQKLALSQRMLQSAEILQMSSQELVEYIKELSVENPVVDCEENVESQNKFDILKKKLDWLDSSDEQNKTYYKEDKEDESSNDNWNFKENSGETLESYLLSQVDTLTLTNDEQRVADYLVQSLDGNGYLHDDINILAKNLNADKKLVCDMLSLVQSLDPPGVGARSLSECLLIQLKQLEIANPIAEKIIKSDLETLGKNQLHVIAKKLKVQINEVLEACNIIKSLNPKPGNSFSSDTGLEYITPDVIIAKTENGYEVILNDYYLPQIRINSYYKTVLSSDTCENDNAKEYVSDKIRQAEWAIKCISKRNSTLVKTMNVILNIQHAFFDKGPGNLAPMKLLDVSSEIEMHESTVSRAIRDKYLQCSWGVFPLYYFFSAGVSKNDNTGMITPEKIKLMIKDIIDNEDKQSPLSDRVISETLEKNGVPLSRRTVAKYRESLNIPGTSGRKGFY